MKIPLIAMPTAFSIILMKTTRTNNLYTLKLDTTIKGEDKAQTWKEGQPPLRENDILLHVEELTSTLATPGRVREGVETFHTGLPYKVNWLHRFVVGVDRRPLELLSELPVVGTSTAVMLTQFPSQLYEPDECPMCQAGSIAIRPRGNDGANWKLLTGT